MTYDRDEVFLQEKLTAGLHPAEVDLWPAVAQGLPTGRAAQRARWLRPALCLVAPLLIAAGVLVGLSELYDAHLSMSELCAIGAGIGADVPFALLGGTCRVRGVGDLMKALPPCPDCRFVVAMPSVGVSTPEAFARYDTMGSPVHPDCEAQEQAIRDCNLAGVCAAGGNALEHCSGAVETPAICKTLREHGAVMAQMTGSGAAVFGIFDDENAARSAVAALKNGYKQVYLCKPTHGGPRVTVRRLFGAKK